MKQHGKVEKIKLKVAVPNKCYDCYILFETSQYANIAHTKLYGHSINDRIVKTKLFSVDNITFGAHHFIPEEMDPNKHFTLYERDQPTMTWHVAEYKEGRDNYMRGSEWIRWKIGNIPDRNIKKYGKKILIEADDTDRVSLLTNFKPPINGNIKCITPHRTFNTLKGVVYSRDLYDYEEQEILERCPLNVYKVQKLKGLNKCILMFFSSKFLPEYITVCGTPLHVKKFKSNPKQCRQCLEYGHIAKYCSNNSRCIICLL